MQVQYIECAHKSGFERYSGTTPLVWDFSAWFSTSNSFCTLSSCSASHFSASRAATQPDPGCKLVFIEFGGPTSRGTNLHL